MIAQIERDFHQKVSQIVMIFVHCSFYSICIPNNAFIAPTQQVPKLAQIEPIADGFTDPLCTLTFVSTVRRISK